MTLNNKTGIPKYRANKKAKRVNTLFDKVAWPFDAQTCGRKEEREDDRPVVTQD